MIVETGVAVESVLERMRELLSGPQRPTAVVANSDFSAQIVYAAVRELALVIGRDLSVVGQDDLPTSRLLDPPLTTVALDRRSIGHAIAERLLEPDRFGDHFEPVELVVRASTGRPAARSPDPA